MDLKFTSVPFLPVRSMSGIIFMVEERGQKSAAVFCLWKCEPLWENFCAALPAPAAREPRIRPAALKIQPQEKFGIF